MKSEIERRRHRRAVNTLGRLLDAIFLVLREGCFWLAVALATGASSGNAAIIVSINGMDNPDLAASWNVPEVGWLYTPTFSYTFSSIGTKFGSSDGRIVNAEIFSGAPGD